MITAAGDAGHRRCLVLVVEGAGYSRDFITLPFSRAGVKTRRSMQDELLRLWEECRFTLMFVTHSIEETVRLGSRIVLLSPHPGRVHSQFDPAEYESGRELKTKIEKILFGESFTNGAGI